MQIAVSRIFTASTFAAYLAVGSFLYYDLSFTPLKIEIPEITNHRIQKTEIPPDNINSNLIIPTVDFEDINNSINKIQVKKIESKQQKKLSWEKLKIRHYLNTNEPISLYGTKYDLMLNTNVASYFKQVESTNQVDQVKTQIAKSKIVEEDDIVFYDYSNVNVEKAVENKAQIVEAVDNKAQFVEAVDNKAQIVEAVDNKAQIVEAVENKAQIVEAVDNKAQIVEAVDNNTIVEAVDNKGQFVEAVDNKAQFVEAVDNKAHNVDETYDVSKLIAYDYSKSKRNMSEKNLEKKRIGDNKKRNNYSSKVTVKAVGVDLKGSEEINGFDVTTHENNQQTEDYSAGFVDFKETIAEKKVNRTMMLSKHGFVNTHTDITFEEGWSEVYIPMLTTEVFNKIISPFEKYGEVGAVLIELDDDTDEVSIDVPYGKVINLNENFKETTESDYRYTLFIGVQAGNALLTYKNSKNKLITKIIHIHERETTFDGNIYEDDGLATLILFEENLLTKEKANLNIRGKDIKVFASDEYSQKVSLNRYKVNFSKKILGSRNYLELNHLDEPIFVGFKANNKLDIPSENLMRYVVGENQGRGLENRCVVQINIDKAVIGSEVGVESVGQSLMTYIQYLDLDGKFYDSPGPKTSKIIIVGENAASEKVNQDSKFNIQINYQDGSKNFFSSYCSPNTYLVEQL